jgi:hypothetical protein
MTVFPSFHPSVRPSAGLLCCLAFAIGLPATAPAQAHAPSITSRAQLRDRMQAATQLLGWPRMGGDPADTAGEELRLWVGSGDLPGFVFRFRHTAAGTSGDVALWWVRSAFGDALRQSFQADQQSPCRVFSRSKSVEACRWTAPAAANWDSVWAVATAPDVQALLFDETTLSPQAVSDTTAMAVEWRRGKRVATYLPRIGAGEPLISPPGACLVEAALAQIGTLEPALHC